MRRRIAPSQASTSAYSGPSGEDLSPMTAAARRTGSPVALAGPSVVVDGVRAEFRNACEDRSIHLASCKARRQRLRCSLCQQTADRVIQAADRLEVAEARARG